MINIYDYDMSELQDGVEYVYVLKCEEDKYYVGYSKQIHIRISQHLRGKGSIWTKKYRPLEIIDIAEGNLEDEEATTYVMMLRHGWKNVRGSYWTSIKLKEPPLYIWSREIIETL